MNVKIAETADIHLLTELRIAYLKEDCGGLTEDVVSKIRHDLPRYFERNLNRNIFCYLIKENEKAVSCAFLLVVEKPLSPMFITGRTGTVLNVYTAPAYRRKGYAKRIMETLLLDAAGKDLSVVELKATQDGYHLYKSLGFAEDTSDYRHMKWRNQQHNHIN